MIVAVACGPLSASDPFVHVPDDVDALVVCRNLRDTVGTIAAIQKRLNPDETPFDLGALERRLGLPPDSWNPSEPVLLMLLRPELSFDSVALGFTPGDPARFRSMVEDRDDQIRRAGEDLGNCFVMMRDGRVFVASDRRPLLALQRVTAERSLAARIVPDERALFARTDVFVRVSMGGWRAPMKPALTAIRRVLELGIATAPMSPDEQAAIREMYALFFERLETVVDQMGTTTLAAAFDRDGLRLIHRHAFRPGGTVAAYLDGVERRGGDPWTALPDRPFLGIYSVDWNHRTGQSITADVCRRMFELESFRAKLPADERRRILESITECFCGMSGMNGMAAPPRGALHPLEVLGAYAFDDSAKGLERLRVFNKYSGEAMSSFTPGWGYLGESRQMKRDGVEYDETAFETDKMDPQTRIGIEAIYGESCCHRQAVAGDRHVVYAMSRGPDAILEMVRCQKAGRNVGGNPAVAKVAAKLPDKPNMIVIVDLGVAIEFSVRMAGVLGGVNVGEGRPPPGQTAAGPLLGWAGVVRPPGVFTGEFYMSTDDFVEMIRLAAQRERQLVPAPGVPAPAGRPRVREGGPSVRPRRAIPGS